MNLIRKELARRELASRGLLPFIKYIRPDYDVGWFHKKLTDTLDKFMWDVENKKSPRLIITTPPRVGKSTAVSEFLPAYSMLTHPNYDIVLATYNQTLADHQGRKVRDIFRHDYVRNVFPTFELDEQTQSANYIKTTQGGMFKATGVGGALTGMGAHILVCDDLIKSREEAESLLIREATWDWYTSVARTRLHPGGGVLMVHTRWHVEDPIGKLLAHAKEHPDGDQWTVIEFPAIATRDEEYRKEGEALHPARYDVDAYRQIRASIPARDWEALYQCRPFIDTGGFFKKEHIKFYDKLPDNLNFVTGGDFATSEKSTSDHSAIVALGVDHNGDIYVHPSIVYDRLSPASIVSKSIALSKLVKSSVMGSEKGVISNLLAPIFKEEMQRQKHWLIEAKMARTQSKAIHALPLAALMEQGKVYFPNTEWMKTTGMRLLMQFMPNVDGEDDFIDALVSAEFALRQHVSPPPPPLPEASKWEHPAVARSNMVRQALKEAEEAEESDSW